MTVVEDSASTGAVILRSGNPHTTIVGYASQLYNFTFIQGSMLKFIKRMYTVDRHLVFISHYQNP